MRVLGWCRTASAGSHAIIAAQREAIETWTYVRGHTIAGWIIEDGVADRIPIAARPHPRPWIEDDFRGLDAIVARDLRTISTLARDIGLLIGMLQGCGKALITLDGIDTSNGRAPRIVAVGVRGNGNGGYRLK